MAGSVLVVFFHSHGGARRMAEDRLIINVWRSQRHPYYVALGLAWIGHLALLNYGRFGALRVGRRIMHDQASAHCLVSLRLVPACQV